MAGMQMTVPSYKTEQSFDIRQFEQRWSEEYEISDPHISGHYRSDLRSSCSALDAWCAGAADAGGIVRLDNRADCDCCLSDLISGREIADEVRSV